MKSTKGEPGVRIIVDDDVLFDLLAGVVDVVGFVVDEVGVVGFLWWRGGWLRRVHCCCCCCCCFFLGVW